MVFGKYGSGALIPARSEEHTSELQSQSNLVCRLLLEKKKKRNRALIVRIIPSTRAPSTRPTPLLPSCATPSSRCNSRIPRPPIQPSCSVSVNTHLHLL